MVGIHFFGVGTGPARTGRLVIVENATLKPDNMKRVRRLRCRENLNADVTARHKGPPPSGGGSARLSCSSVCAV